MTITSVEQVLDGERAGTSFATGGALSLNFTETFRVITDSETEPRLAIIDAVGFRHAVIRVPFFA